MQRRWISAQVNKQTLSTFQEGFALVAGPSMPKPFLPQQLCCFYEFLPVWICLFLRHFHHTYVGCASFRCGFGEAECT